MYSWVIPSLCSGPLVAVARRATLNDVVTLLITSQLQSVGGIIFWNKQHQLLDRSPGGKDQPLRWHVEDPFSDQKPLKRWQPNLMEAIDTDMVICSGANKENKQTACPRPCHLFLAHHNHSALIMSIITMTRWNGPQLGQKGPHQVLVLLWRWTFPFHPYRSREAEKESQL